MNTDAEAEFAKELDRKQKQDRRLEELRASLDESSPAQVDSVHQLRVQDQVRQQRHQTFYDHLQEDFTQESIDMIRFIDWNERRHRVDSQLYLKQNS
jgi:hypothetical protein